MGAYRQLSPAHAPRYLASFAWRFQLDSMLVRFVHSAARTKPDALSGARRWMGDHG